MDKFFKEINKYVVSILLFVAGVSFLGKYLSGDALESQPTAMLISSIALIVVGALATPICVVPLASDALSHHDDCCNSGSCLAGI